MRLNKTEQALLEKAKRHGGTGAISHGYRTMRKNGSWGSRDHKALCSLRDKGLVRIVRVYSWTDCRSRYSDHTTEAVYEVV